MFARRETKLDFLINLEFQKDRQAFKNLDFLSQVNVQKTKIVLGNGIWF